MQSRIWDPLVKRHATIKVTCSAQQVPVRLPIVTLVGFVNFCPCEDKGLGAQRIPFDLCAVGLVKGLLARRGRR